MCMYMDMYMCMTGHVSPYNDGRSMGAGKTYMYMYLHVHVHVHVHVHDRSRLPLMTAALWAQVKRTCTCMCMYMCMYMCMTDHVSP